MVDKVSFPLLEVISDKISSRTMIEEDFVEKIIYLVVDLLSYPNISHYECLKLCKNYLRGYENGVPTHIYLETIGNSGSYSEIEAIGQDLDLVRRLSLGLRVSEEEHDYLKNTVSDLEALVLK